MHLLASCHCHPDLQFGRSYCRCLLFFYNCKLIAYAILLLGLFFCKRLYIFKLLLHLHWRQTAMRHFRVLDADAYNLLYLLNRYSITGFDLFLYRFQIFYHKSSILCDVCVLGAHRESVCCYGRSTCAYSKLGPIPGSGFVQLIKHSILVI